MPIMVAESSFKPGDEVEYISEIPTLPHLEGVDETVAAITSPAKPAYNTTIDANHLRDMRRKLEMGTLTPRDMDMMVQRILPEVVELATDSFGNTVVQKVIERCSDQQRLRILEKCVPYLPSIGVHKNGTWVVQKMVEYARSTTQIQMILGAIKSYTPALLLNAFGNYGTSFVCLFRFHGFIFIRLLVIQGCLKLGPLRNQFIFDAMHHRCAEICQGKFGARSMRACLESPYTTKQQQVSRRRWW